MKFMPTIVSLRYHNIAYLSLGSTIQYSFTLTISYLLNFSTLSVLEVEEDDTSIISKMSLVAFRKG